VNPTSVSQQKLFGVFISSTRSDLTAERELLAWRLLSGPFVPIAAESFTAGPEPSWKVIERKLAGADYYVVIVGGKYGSIDKTDNQSRSFTEREYDYARERMPVMAFLSKEFETLPADKRESDPQMLERVANFRARLRSEQLLYEWSNIGELIDGVRASLTDALVYHPRPGWIRGDSVPENLSIAWDNFVAPSESLGIKRISMTGQAPGDLISAKLRASGMIRILATSGARLLENYRMELIAAATRGASVRVLVPLPGSQFTKDVDDAESAYVDRGTKIDQEVRDTESRLVDIVAAASEDSTGSGGTPRSIDAQIAYFTTHLRSTYTICDDTWAWMTITLPPERAVQSPSLELLKSGERPLIDLCIRNFDRAWQAAVIRGDVKHINNEAGAD
jgi:Domain of unknown function (DUF4062)